jgi:hypothetical protein
VVPQSRVAARLARAERRGARPYPTRWEFADSCATQQAMEKRSLVCLFEATLKT